MGFAPTCACGTYRINMSCAVQTVQVAAAHPVAMDEEDDGGTDEILA